MAAPMASRLTPKRVYVLDNVCVFCGFSFVVTETTSEGNVVTKKRTDQKLRLTEERKGKIKHVLPDIPTSRLLTEITLKYLATKGQLDMTRPRRFSDLHSVSIEEMYFNQIGLYMDLQGNGYMFITGSFKAETINLKRKRSHVRKPEHGYTYNRRPVHTLQLLIFRDVNSQYGDNGSKDGNRDPLETDS